MDVYDQAIAVIRPVYKYHRDESIRHNADQSKQKNEIFYLKSYVNDLSSRNQEL